MADYKDKKKIDITQGSLWKNIIIFSIPLMCSQVLEILFNMTDVAVVGRFASYEALGSVGSTTLLVTLFTGLLIGMGSGINVRAAQQLGAGDDKKTARTVHTSLLLCIIIGGLQMNPSRYI
jgi:Na+-driven multidrug efflux pump